MIPGEPRVYKQFYVLFFIFTAQLTKKEEAKHASKGEVLMRPALKLWETSETIKIMWHEDVVSMIGINPNLFSVFTGLIFQILVSILGGIFTKLLKTEKVVI